MGIALNAVGSLLLLAALLAAAFFVFARVRLDYQAHGRLSRPVAVLQVGYFCVYALSSYAFLDSRLSHVKAAGLLLGFALVLMAVGFLLVVFSMPFLGRRSFGRNVGSLRTGGLYRHSRNPQLVGGLIFIVGYAMLWPSWKGWLWASVWLVIAHLMVRGEEAHLEGVFGDEYRDYCARTPRYLGLPKKRAVDQPVMRRQTASPPREMPAGHGAADVAQNIIEEYLDLLDSQREAVFASLSGPSEEQIWQRPAPKEWCPGEILSHTERFFSSFLPALRVMWTLCGWYGRLRRGRPYSVEIDDVYKRPGFPMWTGFLWTPRHNPKKPVPLAVLKAECEAVHSRVRAFYTGKDRDVLGNIHAYDPAVGVVNLITALKVGVDHDRLHYDDVLRMVASYNE